MEIHLVRELRECDVDTVIDVGANNGLYAVEFSRVARRTICFEPIPECAAQLVELGLQDVDVVNAALSDATGWLELNIPQQDGHLDTACSFLDTKDRVIESARYKRILVETNRLDDHWEANRADRIDLVKIDVEGHELKTLRGGAELLSRVAPPLIVEIEARHCPEWRRTFDFLSDYGYRAYFTDDGRRLRHANSDAVASMQRGTECRGGEGPSGASYINNFVFLANCESPVARALLACVD